MIMLCVIIFVNLSSLKLSFKRGVFYITKIKHTLHVVCDIYCCFVVTMLCAMVAHSVLLLWAVELC